METPSKCEAQSPRETWLCKASRMGWLEAAIWAVQIQYEIEQGRRRSSAKCPYIYNGERGRTYIQSDDIWGGQWEYAKVTEKFEDHFVPKKNIIHEWAYFHHVPDVIGYTNKMKFAQPEGRHVPNAIKKGNFAMVCQSVREVTLSKGGNIKQFFLGAVNCWFFRRAKRAWKKIIADSCEHQGKLFLVVLDYFPRFLKIAHMSSTSSNAVTNKMKEIFSQWGVPEEIMSDNGPQFSSEQFHKFSQDFKHFSASPCYLQPNSEAESGACIAKKILTQPYTFLALMSYRATPHTHTGVIPCQLMMGRENHTPLRTLHPT